jgi:hypothetical protein
MSRYFFFVNHPGGREYFAEDEIKAANLFAKRLAIETGKPIARRDIRGGESWFYPI